MRCPARLAGLALGPVGYGRRHYQGEVPAMAALKNRFVRLAYFLTVLAALAGSLGAGKKW